MIQIISEFDNGKLFYNHCIKCGPNNQEYKTHYHDVFELIFIRSGGTAYLVDGESYPLHKNTLVFTRPSQPHFIQTDASFSYDRYNILFPREILPEDVLAKIPDNLHTINMQDNQITIQLFDKMDYYCRHLDNKELCVVIQSLIQEIIIGILIQVRTANGHIACEKHPVIEKAINYIDNNLLAIQNVEELCGELAVSKSYLYQLFISDLHTTPKKYIMQRRLNMARREMLSGAKATAVYMQCGFEDYSAFYRAYKKYFGYAPNQTNQLTPGTYLL
jgi:AraC-like DNA-binding protein